MCKKFLREAQMSDAAYVDQAADWARSLTKIEARGPGDIENAWRRLEQKYGVPARAYWALRYRPPKNIVASIYFGLRAAYEAECARQLRRLQHEFEITKAIRPSHAAVAAAAAVVGEELPVVNDD